MVKIYPVIAGQICTTNRILIWVGAGVTGGAARVVALVIFPRVQPRSPPVTPSPAGPPGASGIGRLNYRSGTIAAAGVSTASATVA